MGRRISEMGDRWVLRVIVGVCLMLATALSIAVSAKMSQDEFESPVTGNTTGVWGEAEYRQYFAANGTTT